MKTFKLKSKVPYTPEQMFDLVADVECYGDFLPGWNYARIRKSEGNVAYVDQEVGMGGIHKRFTSRAVFTRPERIYITSTDGPFRRLTIHWTFQPAADFGCDGLFYVEVALRSRFAEKFLSSLYDDMMQSVVSAFERRARHLYSHSATPVQLEG